MDVIPAVDLLGGEAVRLVQGDYARRAGTNADPAASVREWVAAGARGLHLVDLDGARTGASLNLPTALALADVARAADATVRVQLGGGIRDAGRVGDVLGAGIDVVILGTAAAARPELVEEAAARWPGRIAASIDVRGGLLAVDGWTRSLPLVPTTLATDLAQRGATTIVVTDVARDGTRSGPNIELMQRVREAAPEVRLIAAGGVSTVAQLRALSRIGVDGAVVGLALLDGSLSLADALAATSAGATA